MNGTAVIGYNIDGNVVNVAAIEIADQHLRKNLYEGAHYRLTAAREDETGTPTHYILTVIPGSKNSESDSRATTISAAELVLDYELDEMVQDESGLKVYYKKKKRTVEQLEQLLEILRNENHELKTKLNTVTDEYKLGWNAAKDEIVSTVKNLEGPT